MTKRDKSARVKVSLPSDVGRVVADIARRDCCSQASVVTRLTRQALQLGGYLDVDEGRPPRKVPRGEG